MRYRHAVYLLPLLMGLTQGLASSAHAERPLQAEAVGWVSAIEGDASAVTIVHGKVPYKGVKAQDPVFLGDKVVVKAKGTKVTVSFSDQDDGHASADSPYTVTAPSLVDIAKAYGAALLNVKTVFDVDHRKAQLASTAPASHKGADDNEVTALTFVGGGPQYIRAGQEQVVPIAWQGGRASVRLFHGDDLIHQTSGLSRKAGAIYFYCPPLKDGENYTLVIGGDEKRVTQTLIGRAGAAPATVGDYTGQAAAELKGGGTQTLQGFADLYAVKDHYYMAHRVLADEIGDPEQTPE